MVSLRKKKHQKLILNITVYEAKDLLPQPQLVQTVVRCNPRCHVKLPPFASFKTARIKDLSNPQWNSTQFIKLRTPPSNVTEKDLEKLPATSFLILAFEIVDRKGSKRSYFGELRLSVIDLLEQLRNKSEIGPKWYKLYSSEREQTFVTGSVRCKFTLSSQRKRFRRRTQACPKVVIESESNSNEVDSEEEYDESDEELVPTTPPSQPSVSQTNEALLAYIRELQDFYNSLKSFGKDPLKLVKISEQNFYTDYSSDLILPSLDGFASINVEDESSDEEQQELKFFTQDQRASELTGSICSSTEDLSNCTSPASFSDLPLTPPTSSSLVSERRRRFGKLRGERLKPNYEFTTGKNSVGMLFVEIISASGLPPLNNSTRTGYDMDPFVVISFGTKVYRTSWRKHTLSPIFNERLAFDILEHEKTFNINFNILDKDYWTLNDPVCERSIPVKLLMTEPVSTSDIRLIKKEEEEDLKYKKRLFGRNPKRNLSNIYDESLKTLEVKMTLYAHWKEKYGKIQNVDPKLKIRVKFESYANLRQHLFRLLLKEYQTDGSAEMDIIELGSFLESIGSNIEEEDVIEFFERHGKKAWHGDKLSFDEIIEDFEAIFERMEPHGSNSSKHIIQIARCPSCLNKARVHDDSDIIKHLAICCSKDWSSVTRILKPSFTTPSSATRRWYTKALIKIAYGKIELGKNNANILVQDRNTGLIIEEKMNVYVRLGIRLLYRSFKGKKNSDRIKRILRNLSIKQGAKFDSPSSRSKIESFIKFHSIDMSEYLIEDYTKYQTFNEFFYRKLKPNLRPLQGEDSRYAVSGADCRCCVFPTVEKSKEIWIKGRDFTLQKLLGPKFDHNLYEDGSIVIFRLAPQDYHRFHSSVDGTVTKIEKVEGEYYTVNPMAIRSKLDVYGENSRVNIEIDSPEFGKVIMSCVGAMMVGSIVLTRKIGDILRRGEEVGYFKFGGSTVLLLFQRGRIVFDSDLVSNSEKSTETLIRVGMSIGHTPEVKEFPREHTDLDKEPEETRLRIIRTLTGKPVGDSSDCLGNWEVQNLDLDDAVSIDLEDEVSDVSS
ncbi:hypothetical protein KL907_002400 [Ogataea polymorpha]|nr:hypothetical protein KL907_002400 [Ogataea polymorpha]